MSTPAPPNRDGYTSDPFLRLTIANMAAQGVARRQIAEQLGLSIGRVRHELERHDATRPRRLYRGAE